MIKEQEGETWDEGVCQGPSRLILRQGRGREPLDERRRLTLSLRMRKKWMKRTRKRWERNEGEHRTRWFPHQ